MAARNDVVDDRLRAAARAVLADFPVPAMILRQGEDPAAFAFLVNELMTATAGSFSVNAVAQALRETSGPS